MAEVRMRDEIQPQIRSFLEGFHELIPADSIKFFDAKELELLISGLPSIDCKLCLIQWTISRTISSTPGT